MSVFFTVSDLADKCSAFSKCCWMKWKDESNDHQLYCCCCCYVASVVSDSVGLHRWQPTRLPRPWDSPGRTLEWVAVSFSNAWTWKVKVKSLSRVRPSVTPWTAAFQAPRSMGFSRQEYWSGVPLPPQVLIFIVKKSYAGTSVQSSSPFSPFPSYVVSEHE